METGLIQKKSNKKFGSSKTEEPNNIFQGIGDNLRRSRVCLLIIIIKKIVILAFSIFQTTVSCFAFQEQYLVT